MSSLCKKQDAQLGDNFDLSINNNTPKHCCAYQNNFYNFD